MTLSKSDFQVAAIIGAGHGIGNSLVQHLLLHFKALKVIATYRNANAASELFALQKAHPQRLSCYQVDVCEETEIQALAKIFEQNKLNRALNLCIICAGFLHDKTTQPEKSLKDINKQDLLKYFEVNSIVTPLIAKHFKPYFSTNTQSVLAVLSAKVGSIGDNHLGGWYGYRASKAALNMFVKNIAIEYQRAQLNTIVVAIHPGTTHSELSKPFLSHIQHKVWQSDETASHLFEVIDHLSLEDTGSFKNWDGASLPW